MKRQVFILKFLFFTLLLFASSSVFAKELSDGEKKALAYIRELCFEVTRYNITGHSPLPESFALSKISYAGSNLLSGHKIRDSVQNPVYLCEFYYPEKTGIIDSTFRDEDLYSVSDDYPDDFTDENAGEFSKFDWVDQVIMGLNIPEGFVSSGQKVDYGIIDGEKLLEILEKGDSRGIETEDSKNDDNPKEFTYSKNDGSIRRFSYDGEQFTVWNEGENTVLVNFYGNKLLRKNFDSLFRLAKSEKFKTGSSAKSMTLENLVEYGYYPESNVLEKTVEENYAAKKRIENHFNERGENTYLLESHYEDREIKSRKKKKDGEKPDTETVLLDDKKTLRTYDEKGRVSEEESTLWSYKKNLMGRYLTEERKTKNVYDYSAVTDENKVPPSVKFYENDELHLERKYKSFSDYSEMLYFDGGFSVEVIYEDGLKKTEITYINGKEQRRREFEY